MAWLTKYFPALTEDQLAKFAAMEELYRTWNAQINVISRKDMEPEQFRLHHILHSLAIAKLIEFPAGCTVLDVGTGGGFPGIPLAVLFPEVRFTLCDSIGKKVKVAQAVADGLQLGNVTCAVFYLKGGDLSEEIDTCVRRCRLDPATLFQAPVSTWFEDPWFAEKKILMISQ